MWGEFFFVEALTKVVCSKFNVFTAESLEKNSTKYANFRLGN